MQRAEVGKVPSGILIHIKGHPEAYKPNRIAIDSVSALERVSTNRGLREFVLAVTSFFKHKEITGLFTSTTPTLTAGASVTKAHISSIPIRSCCCATWNRSARCGADRPSSRCAARPTKRISAIDQRGMHIGRPFRNVTGILAGNPVQIGVSEMERLDELFPPGIDA